MVSNIHSTVLVHSPQGQQTVKGTNKSQTKKKMALKVIATISQGIRTAHRTSVMQQPHLHMIILWVFWMDYLAARWIIVFFSRST